MLKAVQFPAGVTHLATGLANVNGDAFPHFDLVRLKLSSGSELRVLRPLILK